MSYRTIAMPTAVVMAIRETHVSPGYGHPAHVEMATGYGPCRHCLRAFRVGEERRVLFTYDPFADHEDLPLPGPVFIHEEACERYPEDAGFPTDLLDIPMTLNGYASGRRLVAQEYAVEGAVERVLALLLSRDDVDYVHVRDTEAGCFDLRIERKAATRN